VAQRVGRGIALIFHDSLKVHKIAENAKCRNVESLYYRRCTDGHRKFLCLIMRLRMCGAVRTLRLCYHSVVHKAKKYLMLS